MIWNIILFVAFMLSVSPAYATTYYVSTTGSNANNGTDTATPFLTIPHCVSTMVAGDTCYVRGGTYNSDLIRFSRSGTATAPIRLMNYPNETPRIVFLDNSPTGDRILMQASGGINVAIGWIVIEGFEITNGFEAVKWYSLHDTIFRRNWMHHNANHGLLGGGAARVTIDHNIINHNGDIADCLATGFSCNQDHGIYAHGTYITISHNVIYGNAGFGIQQNGSTGSVYSPTKHPSPEFATAANWIVSDNTLAYSLGRGGMTVWGPNCPNLRVENNIFYENSVHVSASPQGIEFTGSGGNTNMIVRNNHFYASGSGGTIALESDHPADMVNTGNVINVSPPAFVNGGSNALPTSPDFRLTASAPVNIAIANGSLNNGIVGAFKTTPTPTASIHGNTMTLTFSPTTKILTPSVTGSSVGCTGTNCPGSPAVSNVTTVPGTDTQVAVTLSGIAGNACVNTNQTWTHTYNAGTGAWTSYDNIGPYPGLHQKIFSHTNLAVTNLCDGGGSGGGLPGTPYIHYKFDEGGGSVVVNHGSGGASKNGALVGGASFVSGGGVQLTERSGQYILIPEGSGLDPSVSHMTIAFGVDVPPGVEVLPRTFFGSPLGINQRFYISSQNGTGTIGVQGSSDATPSELFLHVGRNHFCLDVDATANLVTLYLNGVASTQSGGVKSVTSYALAGNWELGRLAGVANGSGGIFLQFLYYQSRVDCTQIYADWNPVGASVGTFGMPASRFQSVYVTELGGSPTTFGSAINQSKDVIVGGAVAVLLEVHCQDVSDCGQDSFRLNSQHNGTGAWTQVADSGTDLYMWGQDSNTLLNSDDTTSRLSAGSCPVTNGFTRLTSAQVPVIDLPQNGCVVLRYIVRVRETASGYYDLKLSKQTGEDFTGTVNPARINVVAPQASAGP